MKYVLLLILSCFIFSDVLAKDISILNPCTNANIPLNKALSDKSILINKEVSSNNEKMFLISYLDNNGSICYDKKYDILFKVKNQYIYNDKLFNELEDVYPDIGIINNTFFIEFEYGNGQSNIEKYYLDVDFDSIFLNKKEIIYSRSGKPKIVKLKNINIKDIEFYKLINIY